MQLTDHQPGSEPLPLVIEALEGGYYIALTQHNGKRAPLLTERGDVVKGHSLACLRKTLGHLPWSSVTLGPVHTT